MPQRTARPKLNCRGAAGECRYHPGADTTGAATQHHGWPTATQVMCLSERGLALSLGRQLVRLGPSTMERPLETAFLSGARCLLCSARPSARVTVRAILLCTEEELIPYGPRRTRRELFGHPQFRRTREPCFRLQESQPCRAGHERPKQALQRHQKYRPS